MSEDMWKERFEYMLKKKFYIRWIEIDDFMEGPKYLIIFWMWHVHIMIKFFLPRLVMSFPTREKYVERILHGEELYEFDRAIDIGWLEGKTPYSGWRR